MIYTIKTIIGRENIVMEMIAARVREENDNVRAKYKDSNLTEDEKAERIRKESLNIQALFHPEEIKGYVFIEGDMREIERATQAMVNVRGILRKPVDMKDISKFLQPTRVDADLNLGDLVEVIGGPFKGEKGKVTRYEKQKREVTLELLEAAVPIPLTVGVDLVKLNERAKK